MIKSTKKVKKSAVKNDSPAPELAKPAAPAPAVSPVAQAVVLKSPATPAPAAPVKTQSPKTARISLEFVNPAAKAVYVAGSFNEWKPEKTPLTAKGNGRFVGDLAVKPGRHEYLFVVDGQWMPDPNAKESVQNPFGGRNSILSVSE